MFFYPWEKLAEDAQSGDLFVCHIVREAKPVFDPLFQLEKLRSLFRLRSSYAREIAHAGALGWLLDRHAGAFNSQVVSRRMIWCARTILIARLAERGTPEFAPAALAASAPVSAASLLQNRHQRRVDATMRQRFRQFLMQNAGPPPLPDNATIDDYRAFRLGDATDQGVQFRERSARVGGVAKFGGTVMQFAKPRSLQKIGGPEALAVRDAEDDIFARAAWNRAQEIPE